MIFIFLCPTASAHTGRTDSNGGHTDHSTGDYHYHHGYSAHAHFDMDGDGILDCPYDFDDQTNYSVGTVSSSGSYADGKRDGYTEGYADGYKKGKEDGYESGFLDGKSEAAEDHNEKLKEIEDSYTAKIHEYQHIFTIALLFISVCFLMVHRSTLRKKKKAWAIEEKERREKLEWTYTTEINKRNALHDAKVKKLNLQLLNLQRFTLLDKIAAREDLSIQLPNDIHLKQTYTAIKGNISKNYPYGEYTVFMTQAGKKYHCKHDCVPSAKPVHFFDLTENAEPCRNCIRKDMLPQPIPDWYTQIREKLDSEYIQTEQEQ